MQPVPTVSESDVARVLRRDFPADLTTELQTLLDEYGTKDRQRERERVQLAVLKLAAGSTDIFLHYLTVAVCDYRDDPAPAEYPNYMQKNVAGIKSLSAEELAGIINAD